MSQPIWIVNIKDGPSAPFEISVVRSDNTHGIDSYGWFDENKLLISHSGGPCPWGVKPFVWDMLIKIAERVADRMNRVS